MRGASWWEYLSYLEATSNGVKSMSPNLQVTALAATMPINSSERLFISLTFFAGMFVILCFVVWVWVCEF